MTFRTYSYAFSTSDAGFRRNKNSMLVPKKAHFAYHTSRASVDAFQAACAAMRIEGNVLGLQMMFIHIFKCFYL